MMLYDSVLLLQKLAEAFEKELRGVLPGAENSAGPLRHFSSLMARKVRRLKNEIVLGDF